MKTLISILMILVPGLLLASDPSPYAGQESRTISSLSAAEIDSLLRGDGMGFAKLAELNSFPGPKHVLDMSEKLGLSASQVADTQSLFEEMQASAIEIGEKIIAAEARLDLAFDRATINQEMLHEQLQAIGNLRAQLRYIHLEAHLRQKQLLSPSQARQYDAIRGYHSASH